MSELLTDLQKVKNAAADLTRRRAKQEADIENFETKLKADLKRLKEEYGVKTIAEAKEKLEQLEGDLRKDIDVLQAALEEA
jgi:hypothetical protein